MKEGVKRRWKLEYKIETLLCIEEVTKRLEGEIAGYRGFTINVEDYLFFSGNVNGRNFKMYPNPRRMPLPGGSDPLLPKIQGEIAVSRQGGSIIYFQLKVTPLIILVYILYLYGCYVSWCADHPNPIIFVFIGGLITLLIRQYWKYIGRLVVEWLSALWDAGKEK